MVRQDPNVLSWINGQREQQGRKLLSEIPDGKRKSARCCPIANALKDVYPDVQIFPGDKGKPGMVEWMYGQFPLPEPISAWALEFDKPQEADTTD